MTEETQKKKRTVLDSISDNPTIEKDIPEDQVWIDDVFFIKKTRFGLFVSVLKEPIYGAQFITGPTEEAVLQITRWHLKCLQEDSLDEYTRVVNDGFVGGKL